MNRLSQVTSAAGCAALKAIVLLTLAWAPWCVAAPFLVVTSNYPPYSFVEEGVPKGMAVDVMKAAFARMKEELTVEFLPFPRAIRQFQQGEADGIFPFSFKEERAVYTLFPKEYLIADTTALFTRADAQISFTGDINQLGAYFFGKQRDAFNGQVFTDAVKAGVINKITEAEDQRRVVLMLMAARFDIAVGPRQVVRYYARETGNGNNIKELLPALEKPVLAYLGFSKPRKHNALSLRFDQTIAQMRRDGSYQKIIDSYLK